MSTPNPFVISTCSKCERHIYSDGTQQGGSDQCMPHTFVIPTQIVIPHVEEVKEKDNINSKVQQVAKIISKLQSDERTLTKNHEKVQDTIDELFKKIHNELEQRKDILVQEAKHKYQIHYDRLEEEIIALNNYTKEIEQAKQNMTESVKKNPETPQRIQENVRNMKEALNKEPKIFEIPTDIQFKDNYGVAIQQKIQEQGKIILTDLKYGKMLLPSKKNFRDPKLPCIVSLSGRRNLNNPQKIELSFRLEFENNNNNNNNNEDEEEMNRIETLELIKNNSKIEFECIEMDYKNVEEGYNNNNHEHHEPENEEEEKHEMDYNIYKYIINNKDLTMNQFNGNDKTFKNIIIEKEFNLNKIIKIRGHIIYNRNNNLKINLESYHINPNQMFESKWSDIIHIGFIINLNLNGDKKYMELSKHDYNLETIMNRIRESYETLSNSRVKLSLKENKTDKTIIREINDDELQKFDGDISNHTIMIQKKIMRPDGEENHNRGNSSVSQLQPNAASTPPPDEMAVKFIQSPPQQPPQNLMNSVNKLHFLAVVEGSNDKRRIKMDPTNEIDAVKSEIQKRCKVASNFDVIMPDKTILTQSSQLLLLSKNQQEPPLLIIKNK